MTYNLIMPGLYVHIPFCIRKCHYCDFVIAPADSPDGRAPFLTALDREASRLEPELEGTEFDTVYLGGGTPSTLNAEEFENLFKILRSRFHWKKEAEITCEVNPDDIDSDKASLLKKLGVNRVSLGAQSFHDDTLKSLNRAHDAQAIESSFRLLREAGFANINLDLILSLPGEGWERAQASLEKLATLDPEHVSIYELSIEEKTVFGALHRQGKLRLPEEDEQYEILSKARKFLQERGWRHYELLNYSKPGRESRHNLLYWANEDTVGLGPGAYAYYRGRRTRLTDSYSQYLAKTAAGDWKPLEDETLSEEKREVESFLLALRLIEGAQAERFASVLRQFEEEISDLTENGLLLNEAGRVKLTARGQFLAETVFTELSC